MTVHRFICPKHGLVAVSADPHPVDAPTTCPLVVTLGLSSTGYGVGPCGRPLSREVGAEDLSPAENRAERRRALLERMLPDDADRRAYLTDPAFHFTIDSLVARLDAQGLTIDRAGRAEEAEDFVGGIGRMLHTANRRDLPGAREEAVAGVEDEIDRWLRDRGLKRSVTDLPEVHVGGVPVPRPVPVSIRDPARDDG